MKRQPLLIFGLADSGLPHNGKSN